MDEDLTHLVSNWQPKFNNLTPRIGSIPIIPIDSKLINSEQAALISSWIQGNNENKIIKFITNFNCLLVEVVMDLREKYFIKCAITKVLQLQS